MDMSMMLEQYQTMDTSQLNLSQMTINERIKYLYKKEAVNVKTFDPL